MKSKYQKVVGGRLSADGVRCAMTLLTCSVKVPSFSERQDVIEVIAWPESESPSFIVTPARRNFRGMTVSERAVLVKIFGDCVEAFPNVDRESSRLILRKSGSLQTTKIIVNKHYQMKPQALG